MKKIQSLERAMQILALLDSVGGNNGLGVGELARLARLKAPTAHNILQTFLQLGYIEQCEHCRYRLAEKTKFLGWDGSRKDQLIRLVQPHLMHLAYETGETVLLAARSGKMWQTLLKIESAHLLTARSTLPMTDNFYISATGRCILSSFTPSRLQEFVRNYRLPEESEWPGAGTFEGMMGKLRVIHHNGYEIYSNPRDGITGVGAVLPRIANASDGALGVIVPNCRFSGSHKKLILDRILQAAGSIG